MYCSGLSYLQLPPHSQCRNIRSINRVFFTNIYLNGSSQNKIRSLIVCIAHLFNNLFLNCNRQHSSVACSQNSIFVFKFSSYVIAMQAGSTLWRHSMFGYASMRRLILATIDGSQYNYNVFV